MIYEVAQFGLPKNIAAGVTEALRQMQPGDTLHFPKGEYHFYKDYCQSLVVHTSNTDSFQRPKKTFGILLQDKEQLTLDGDGSVFVFHGNISALGVLRCRQITLRNFTIRYACPTNVELEVTAKQGHTVSYRVPENQPFYMDGGSVVFFEQSPFTKKNYWQMRNNENSSCAVRHQGETVFREVDQPFFGPHRTRRTGARTFDVWSLRKKKYQIGETVALSMNNCRETAGAFFSESSDLAVAQVTVNYLHGFGWLTQMCRDVSFTGVHFHPDSQHHVSSFADCIHVCGCKGTVTIKDCSFTQAHDDAINIHGAFLRFVRRVDDHTAVFQFVHRQQGGYRAFFPGDTVRFYYRSSLQPCGEENTVAAVEDDIDAKTCTLTFDRPLPEDIDAKFRGQQNVVIENASYCPNVEISGCSIHGIPTRGILCTTGGHVDIHHNTFEHVFMANVFVSNDANDWYESGPVRDMQIHHNVFHLPTLRQKRFWPTLAAVLVEPITMGGKITAPVHSGIRIFENEITLTDGYALWSKGGGDIEIDDQDHPVHIEPLDK